MPQASDTDTHLADITCDEAEREWLDELMFISLMSTRPSRNVGRIKAKHPVKGMNGHRYPSALQNTLKGDWS